MGRSGSPADRTGIMSSPLRQGPRLRSTRAPEGSPVQRNCGSLRPAAAAKDPGRAGTGPQPGLRHPTKDCRCACRDRA